MKRFFICFAMFIAMLFTVGCNDNDIKNYNKDNNGNSSGNNDDHAIPCTRDENYYGTKKCIDGHSHVCICVNSDENENGDEICNKYLWAENDICKGGCNESTGQCKKAECSIEQAEAEIYECFEDYSFKCEKDDSSHAYWEYQNFCIVGCNESTGRCPLCDEGTSMCYEYEYYSLDVSLICKNNKWKIKDTCFTGCDKSTGKCNPCQENTFICYEDSYGSDSYKCEDGNFTYYGECGKSGCDSSSGKCRCTDFVEGYKTCYNFDWELRTCINGFWEIKECRHGCDRETLSCKGEACYEEGAFRCNGNMLQKCDQEEWKNFMQCNSDQTCNAEKVTCEDDED